MGTLFLSILNIVMPVFLVIGLGYGLKRSSLMDAHFIFQLNRLIYYLALPLLLFYKIATADFMQSFDFPAVAGYAVSVVLMFILSYLYGMARGYNQDIRGVFSQCAFRGNLAYVGLAIIFNGYGEKGLATAGILLGFMVPMINFFSIIALLLPYRDKKIGASYFVKQLAANPMIIAPLIGIVWSFLGIPVPLVFDKALHIVTGMALPLALISIGASFSIKKLQGDLGLALENATFKLILTPLITAAIIYAFGARGLDLVVSILCAATPTATACYVMTQQIRGDAELAGTVIMLTTLFSIFSYTVILMILKGFGL